MIIYILHTDSLNYYKISLNIISCFYIIIYKLFLFLFSFLKIFTNK